MVLCEAFAFTVCHTRGPTSFSPVQKSPTKKLQEIKDPDNSAAFGDFAALKPRRKGVEQLMCFPSSSGFKGGGCAESCGFGVDSGIPPGGFNDDSPLHLSPALLVNPSSFFLPPPPPRGRKKKEGEEGLKESLERERRLGF